jgi:glycosyltransferase involved in cell wall biosynthesis
MSGDGSLFPSHSSAKAHRKDNIGLPMKVLVLHSRYTELGGEDIAVESEEQLLATQGHTVLPYRRNNAEIEQLTLVQRAVLPGTTVWSNKSLVEVRHLALDQQPDVAHFHNTFPLISPAAYSACRSARIPVVQTLHNYRLLCPAATFFRDGKPCECCMGKRVPWPAVRYACYRGSRTATGTVAAMLAIHRVLGTWMEMIDIYIAGTEFARDKFIAGGLPAAKIVVKPNFVHPDPGADRDVSGYALFVGRLSPEKGLGTLLAAWKQLGGKIPLLIAGDGPMRSELEALVQQQSLFEIQFLGRLDRQAVFAAMKRARFLVVPSECYENFPVTIVEAYARGTPTIVAGHGALKEIVADQRTGLHFVPGDAEDLARKAEWAWTHPREMEEIGQAGRAEFVAKYSADRNYHMLMDIYKRAIESRR